MITIKQLSARVAAWMDSLEPLGVRHWVMEVEIADQLENPHAAASMDSSDFYDKGTMAFQREFLAGASDERLDEVIVHELLHAAMRDLNQVEARMEQHLSPEVYRLWDAQLNHEMEGFVDRLSKAIVALAAK